MASIELNNLLVSLDLDKSQAVFFYKKKNRKAFSLLSNETQKKLTIIKPTAYYVFNNQPYILFFDLTDSDNLKRETEIHKQVWSFDQAPIIFIIKDTDVEIYNALAYNKKQNSLEPIKISEQERNEQFSFWNLQSGESWKWLQKEYYKSNIKEKRVNQKLFENIRLVREKLTDKNTDNFLSDDEANTLILRLIFIRYLIDRNVKLDNKDFITGKDKTERRISFIELIEKPRKLNEFFGDLNEKFNGVLFKDIKFQITKDQAAALAKVFKGESPEQGRLFYGGEFYFEIFDFSIIPVEVISGIYESLIDEETRNLHSAVYTPSFLVEYILSNTIDKYFDNKENKSKTECKIFDPSVGSGIFIVQGFRRMVDREIDKNKGKEITKVRLREIAETNLFGIDINPQALKVACFSIYIAILDYRDPNTILDNFHFPKLIGENLFEANFFNTEHSFNEIIKSKKIDFILGNPPWKNGSDDPIHKKYLKENNLLKIVSDFQLAQSFLIRTKDFSSNQSQNCLIVTSKAMYNTNADEFRKYFLENFYLTRCFDLSPVRRLIFEDKDNPAMILQFQYSNGQNTLNNIVFHQSLKYNIYLKYFKALVIEKSDTKKIKQKFFYENSWMFKVALYGGVLDYILITKLTKYQFSLRSYVDEFPDNIYIGDGIKKHTANSLIKLKKIPEPFIEIKDIPIIETTELVPFFVDVRKNNLPKDEDMLVKSGGKIEQYKGDKILFSPNLIKETEIVIPYSKGNAVFREKTLGITSKTETSVLKEIYALCSSDLYVYFQFLISSHWGIYYPQILQKEYLSFPYNKPDTASRKRMIGLAEEVIALSEKHYAQKSKSEELVIPKNIFNSLNKLTSSIYHIQGYEKDLIDFVLKVARYQFQSEGKQKMVTDFTYSDKTHYRNRDLVLKNYATVFLKEFKKIYEDEFIQIKVYALNHFIAMNFIFLNEKPEDDVHIVPKDEISDEKQVFSLIANGISISEIAKDLYIQKDIKGFEENSFYIIKPNEYKCWHRAMAWYDVAEIKESIQSAELKRLKKN